MYVRTTSKCKRKEKSSQLLNSHTKYLTHYRTTQQYYVISAHSHATVYSFIDGRDGETISLIDVSLSDSNSTSFALYTLYLITQSPQLSKSNYHWRCRSPSARAPQQ